jgi:hypothetical protein
LKCLAINPPGSKFCNECGTPLTPAVPSARPGSSQQTGLRINISLDQFDASSSPDGERKTATALFADIKGSMELMEDLDLEEARVIVDPALKLMIEAVHRYDG